MERGIRTAFACLVALIGLVVPATAGAATIAVNTTEPESTTQCGLANAITAANTNAVSGGCTGGSFAAPDRIEFALPPSSTILLKATLPPIGGEVMILGPGPANLVVSGGDTNRVFSVAAISARITRLTVADGKSKDGGGIFIGPGASLELEEVTVRGNETISISGTAMGGGILNAGTLTIKRSSKVAENIAKSTQGLPAEGGGIYNAGTMQIEDSTIEANEATHVISSGIGTRARGGGVLNQGKMTVLASTVRANKATASGGETINEAEGAGVEVISSSETKIARSTFTANSTLGSGGGLGGTGASVRILNSTFAANSAGAGANLSPASAELRSTIVADPLGGGESCAPPGLESLGFNIVESCPLLEAKPTDQIGVDPLLGPLADDGGPTETMALLPGSPAIDRGVASEAETADQRGLPRPIEIAGVANAAGGDGTDVGAFELQAPRATIVKGPAEGATIDDRRPSFEFLADDPQARFACSLDGGAAVPCSSPYQLPELAPGPHSFSVGALDSAGYGQPAASRGFAVSAPPAPPSPPPTESKSGAAQDSRQSRSAPHATILALPAKTARRQLQIRFAADQPGSTFSCKLDKRPWRSCRSPFPTPRLKSGRHTFEVKATGPTGLPAVPVGKTFQVLAQH